MKISGIYKIQSKINPNRCYIGSSINIKKRREDHITMLRKNKHHSLKLQRHYNKYGEKDLQFSILLGCEESLLIVNEQFFIDSYNPYFNICTKAGNTLGYKHSLENKYRMSVLKKGYIPWNKGKRKEKVKEVKIYKERKGMKLKPFTDEHKHNMSIAKKGANHPSYGKQHTPDHNKKISEGLKGRIPWNKGKKWNEEQKVNLKIAAKNRPKSTEADKQKMREVWLKRKLNYININ